jgi:hypothetical protein
MFSSSFTMSEQEHRQWTPYKHDAPDIVMSINSQFCESEGNYTCAPDRLRETRWLETERGLFLSDLTASQLAGIVVILDDIDVTALLRIALDDCKLAVPEFFDLLGLAVKIVIADFAG